MNLTMKYTIIEFSVHPCNFVFKVLHREEPGAGIVVTITTQNSHFSKFQYIHLPSCITFIPIPLFTLVTQLSKSVEKNLAYYRLFNFWNKHFMPL